MSSIYCPDIDISISYRQLQYRRFQYMHAINMRKLTGTEIDLSLFYEGRFQSLKKSIAGNLVDKTTYAKYVFCVFSVNIRSFRGVRAKSCGNCNITIKQNAISRSGSIISDRRSNLKPFSFLRFFVSKLVLLVKYCMDNDSLLFGKIVLQLYRL